MIHLQDAKLTDHAYNRPDEWSRECILDFEPHDALEQIMTLSLHASNTPPWKLTAIHMTSNLESQALTFSNLA